MSRATDRPVDLNQLDIFLTIASAGSMSGAATVLGVSQPAVSQALAQLEHSLGLTLVDRSRRPLALTSAGVYMSHNAGALIAMARQLKMRAVEASQSERAFLRIGVIDSVANAIGPSLIKWLLERTSGLSVQIGMAVAQERALLDREVDLIISTNALAERPEFDHRFLYRENFIAITQRGSNSGADPDPPVTLQSLAETQSLIRYSHSSTLGIRVERVLRHNAISPPRILEVDHADTLTLLVSQGLGWAITTPTCLLQTGVRFVDAIDLVPIDHGNSTRPIYAIARSGEFPLLTEALAGKVREALDGLLSTHPRLRKYVPKGSIEFDEPQME